MSLRQQRILLVTIPHTGTQFFSRLLEQHFNRIGFVEMETNPLATGYVQRHTTPETMAWLPKVRQSVTLLTTERDRDAMNASYRRRGKKPNQIDVKFMPCYRELLKMEPIVMSVDAPDREKRLVELGRALGVVFKTDWAPVGVYEAA